MSAPVITPADVERLVAVLAAGEWMTAAEISVALYGADTEGHKRRVRATASAAAPGVVSYPGSPGYKLWQRCSADELHACINAYTTQTDDMRRRRDLYRRRLHRENPAKFAPDSALRPTREQLFLGV